MKWECVECGELEKREVTEELHGDQSFNYCNRCGFRSVSRIRPRIQLAAPPRPKRFCFFIKPKDGDIYKPFVQYTRIEQFCLAVRIGYFREAFRLAIGKPSRYIW